MVTTARKTEEKGQRTPRSRDNYRLKGGISGGAYCGCGAVYKNKRWSQSKHAAAPDQERMLVCPACRRIADRNPAGIVSLSGSFLAKHSSEINSNIKKIAENAALKNPLDRIIAINSKEDAITITTTGTKLARKIGRELFKSFSGDLQYNWSTGEDLVRVRWSRHLA